MLDKMSHHKFYGEQRGDLKCIAVIKKAMVLEIVLAAYACGKRGIGIIASGHLPAHDL